MSRTPNPSGAAHGRVGLAVAHREQCGFGFEAGIRTAIR